MNKFLIIAALLLSAFTVDASTTQTQSFVFDGTQSTKELKLTTVKDHVEYTTETVDSTCYEQVQTGTTQECREVSEEVCDDAISAFQTFQRPLPPGPPPPPSENPPSRPEPPGPPPPPSYNPPSDPPSYNPPPPSCRTVYRTVCEDVPQYENRPYACQQQVQVPHTIKDYDVNATILLNFGTVPNGIKPNEEIDLSLTGDQLTVSAKDSKQLVLFAERKDQSQVNGGTLALGVALNIEMASLAEILAPFSSPIDTFAVKANILTFNVGTVDQPETFLPHLFLRQGKGLFSSGKTLIDRDLKQNEYHLINGATGRTQVVIDIAALGVKIDQKQDLEVQVTANLVLSGNILNPKIVPAKKQLVGKAKIKLN